MAKPKERLYSAVDGLNVRPSGPWIRKKHFYLRRYADIFSKGMKNKWPQRTFIDLFSGPGKCVIESTKEELDGSPLIVMGFDFTHYIFIEQDSEDFEALKKRCSTSPKYNQMHFLKGDCNKEVGKILPQGLSLAFIDPTGIDVHFETIKTLSGHGNVDLLMNIQFGMDIKRNFQHYLKTEGNALELFLGGDFRKKLKDPRDVLTVYKEQISGLGYRTVEFSDIVVTNSKSAPMYFLFFASKHPRGLDFWKKITAKDEKGQMEMF